VGDVNQKAEKSIDDIAKLFCTFCGSVTLRVRNKMVEGTLFVRRSVRAVNPDASENKTAPGIVKPVAV
jgi:hypothetical protein